MAFEPFRQALSGAGYDDQNANNDAYRNPVGGVEQGPSLRTVGHRGQKFEFSRKVWLMQEGQSIDYFYMVISYQFSVISCAVG
jgi:hypothetical protein